MAYPPFAHLGRIIGSHPLEDIGEKEIWHLYRELELWLQKQSWRDRLLLAPPIQAPLSRLQGRHRWLISLKASATFPLVYCFRFLAQQRLAQDFFCSYGMDPG